MRKNTLVGSRRKAMYIAVKGGEKSIEESYRPLVREWGAIPYCPN